MSERIDAIIYPVKDLAVAKSLFGELTGVEPYADESYYVGYKVDGKDIGLDPTGHKKGMSGAVVFWRTDDIEASLRALLDAGAEELSGIKDVGGGKLIATVKDADGNVVGLAQPA
jgi:predicted enzyme related to lactoylglutathione lyase